jgi:4-amino-4-deoxy-L-arabinose transferase-like glycosyltransferase
MNAHRAVAAGLAVSLVAASALIMFIPASWVADLTPYPDAVEYAMSARSLARSGSYSISLLGGSYPPRYPFGFPLLLAPVYWLADAPLASGIYAVAAFGVLAILLIYLLASATTGLIGAAAGALVVMLSPALLQWSHAIMTETATAALVATAALLLYAAVAAHHERTRHALVLALSLACGFAHLVRFSNALVVGAAAVALALHQRDRRGVARSVCWLAPGPLLAFVALGLYHKFSFGSIWTTGYHYWEPESYSLAGKTFSLAYAFRPHPSYPEVVVEKPNLLFYTTDGPLGVFSVWTLLVAAAGLVFGLRDQRSAVRAVSVFGIVLTVPTLAFYSVYFYQDRRFLVPLVPLIGLWVAHGVAGGVRMLREGSPPRGPIRVVGALALCSLGVVGLLSSVGPALDHCVAWQRYVRRDWTLYRFPLHPANAVAYRQVVPPGSILITDVLLPLLEEAGVTAGNTVVPLHRRSYWNAPAFRTVGTFLDQQSLIADALRQGRGVFMDSYSLNRARASAESDRALWQAIQTYGLTPVAHGSHGVTIYQLLRSGRPRVPDP